MQSKILIPIFIVVVFILGGLLYIYNPDPTEYKNPNIPEPVVCSMEAKLCSDGSYVGRTGPNCEFHCPAVALCKGGIPCPTSTTTPSQ